MNLDYVAAIFFFFFALFLGLGYLAATNASKHMDNKLAAVCQKYTEDVDHCIHEIGLVR